MAKKKTTAPKASPKSCRTNCGPKPKAAAKKSAATPAPAAKKEVKASKKKSSDSAMPPVPAKDAVGFRLRMTPAIHKMLKTKSEKEGVSQNTYINQLIQEAD